MQTFQFQLSNDFLTVPIDKPIFFDVEYSTIGDNKVCLMDLHIPPAAFPYIKDNYRLHDAIYHAAENNHASNMAAQADHQHDLFKEMGITEAPYNSEVFVKIFEHFKIAE